MEMESLLDSQPHLMENGLIDDDGNIDME